MPKADPNYDMIYQGYYLSKNKRIIIFRSNTSEVNNRNWVVSIDGKIVSNKFYPTLERAKEQAAILLGKS